MKVLTDEQRARLMKALEGAPDEILCDAVAELKRYRISIQDTYKDVAGYIGREETKLVDSIPKGKSDPVNENVSKALEEIAPGAKPYAAKPETAPGIACSRVGGDTKDAIKAKCMVPSTAAEINKFLKRGDGKLPDTVSILKLLWDRGELVYSQGTYRNK